MMQKTNIKNIMIQALKPSRFSIMLKKVKRRIFDATGNHSESQNLKWIQAHCSDFENFAVSLDASLWDEAKQVSMKIQQNAEKILSSIDYDLGGGGIYPLLYFMTRYIKANCIVETGVAAGFSSYAFLLAIRANGRGRLYSSDFPYFRLPNPEQYIGIVVEDSLKEYWDLYIDGDEANLPRILSQIKEIDIFHYDSDKSYSGRKSAMSMIDSRLKKGGIILMDDIQDNSFFQDYIEKVNPDSWSVFKFQGKYIGMIGKPTSGFT